MDLKNLRGAPSPFTSHWSCWPSFWLFPGLPAAPSNYLNNLSAVQEGHEKEHNRY